MGEIKGTVTRIYALPADVSPRAEAPLLHEWHADIPYMPEGSFLAVGEKTYRVRYRSVTVDEESGAAAEVDAHVGSAVVDLGNQRDAVVNRYLATAAFQRADGVETLQTAEAA